MKFKINQLIATGRYIVRLEKENKRLKRLVSMYEKYLEAHDEE